MLLFEYVQNSYIWLESCFFFLANARKFSATFNRQSRQYNFTFSLIKWDLLIIPSTLLVASFLMLFIKNKKRCTYTSSYGSWNLSTSHSVYKSHSFLFFKLCRNSMQLSERTASIGAHRHCKFTTNEKNEFCNKNKYPLHLHHIVQKSKSRLRSFTTQYSLQLISLVYDINFYVQCFKQWVFLSSDDDDEGTETWLTSLIHLLYYACWARVPFILLVTRVILQTVFFFFFFALTVINHGLR